MRTLRIVCLSTVFSFNALIIFFNIKAICETSLLFILFLVFFTPYVLFIPVFWLNIAIIYYRRKLFHEKRFSIYHILIAIYIIPQMFMIIEGILMYVRNATGK